MEKKKRAEDGKPDNKHKERGGKMEEMMFGCSAREMIEGRAMKRITEKTNREILCRHLQSIARLTEGPTQKGRKQRSSSKEGDAKRLQARKKLFKQVGLSCDRVSQMIASHQDRHLWISSHLGSLHVLLDFHRIAFPSSPSSLPHSTISLRISDCDPFRLVIKEKSEKNKSLIME